MALVGRQAESGVLEQLAESVRSGMGQALVLRGVPGVGKSALLEQLPLLAPDIAFVRLSGIESEMALGFAGLHRLLLPYLGKIGDLPGPQSQALGSALGILEGPPANLFLVSLAVLSLLADAADNHPLCWVIDDAQWVDAESLEVVAFVARRLQAEKLALVFALREPAQPGVLEGLPELRVEGLAHPDATELLLELSSGRVDRPMAERIATQAGGNPLVLAEVGKELAAGVVPGGLLVSSALPVGERLEAHFRLQVATLPSDTQTFLLLAAAMPRSDPAVLREAASILGLPRDAAVPAESAGLLISKPEYRFSHPLIRSAVYSAEAGERRRHVHQVLAKATDPGDQPDVRAWHMAASTIDPDETVAGLLESCGEAVRARGGYLAESAFLARASELTPEREDKALRGLAAAEAALKGGAPLVAEALLESVEPNLTTPLAQGQARRMKANLIGPLNRPGQQAPAMLLAASRIFEPVDTVLAKRTMLDAFNLAAQYGNRMTGATTGELGRAALSLPADPDYDLAVEGLVLQGMATFCCHGYVKAVPAMREAVKAMLRSVPHLTEAPSWTILGALLAHCLWDDSATCVWLEGIQDLETRTGALDGLTRTLPTRVVVEAGHGHLSTAESLLAEHELVVRAKGEGVLHGLAVSSCELLAWKGDESATREAADTLSFIADYVGLETVDWVRVRALIILALGHGRYEEAFDVADVALREEFLMQSNECLPALVEAGVRIGRLEAAANALEELRIRATASGTAWALGLLSRSSALLAQDEDAEALYLDGIENLSSTTAQADLARAHLLYGEWLRRQNRRLDARSQLRLALGYFEAMEAMAFSERARTELLATGERARRRTPETKSTLTFQEIKIARMASRGATNPEIAAQLFVSTSTVDYHLRKVYRKLGVSSRRQLERALPA